MWGRHTSFLAIELPGFWMPRAANWVEGEVLIESRGSLSELSKRAGECGGVVRGGDPASAQDTGPAGMKKKKIPPDGAPIRLGEGELSAKFRPESDAAGDYFICDLSRGAGRAEASLTSSRGNMSWRATTTD